MSGLSDDLFLIFMCFYDPWLVVVYRVISFANEIADGFRYLMNKMDPTYYNAGVIYIVPAIVILNLIVQFYRPAGGLKNGEQKMLAWMSVRISFIFLFLCSHLKKNYFFRDKWRD